MINKPIIKPLEQAEIELKECFNRAMEAKDNKIYVIKAPTGIGKTKLYLNQKNVTIAIPTHALKEEVAEKMTKKGNKVTSTPKLPEDDNLKRLYSIGSYMFANQYIRKMEKEGKQEFIDYVAQVKEAEKATGTILTTHDKLLSLKNSSNTFIIDEDIIPTLLPVNTTTLKALKTMAEECCFFDTMDTLGAIKDFAVNTRDNIVNEMPSFGGIKTSKLETLVHEHKINSNVLGFLNCSHFVRQTIADEVIFHYINRRELPLRNKIIMLSATANEDICKLMFGDRLEFIDIGQVETIGNIQQYSQRSCSRWTMKKDENIKKWAKALTKGKPIITFKEFIEDFDNVIATFGATEGLDGFGGQDIAVIGTPHINAITYLLYANAMGKKPRLNDTRTSMLYVKVKHNGFEFYFNTFSNDEILQEIQLYLIESELVQAVGRSRIIRKDCTVTVLSNLPVQGANFKYLTKEENEQLLCA